MPIYEYRCKSCNRDFEAIVWSLRDEETTVCPTCNSKDVSRILSPFVTTSGSGGQLSSGAGASGCGPGGGRFS